MESSSRQWLSVAACGRLSLPAIIRAFINGTDVSKLPFSALVATTLAGVAACGPTIQPDQLAASIRPGMTQGEVYKRMGPPDRGYLTNGLDCFQYDLGKFNLGSSRNVPFSVYFDDSNRVAGTARVACRGRRI